MLQILALNESVTSDTFVSRDNGEDPCLRTTCPEGDTCLRGVCSSLLPNTMPTTIMEQPEGDYSYSEGL